MCLSKIVKFLKLVKYVKNCHHKVPEAITRYKLPFCHLWWLTKSKTDLFLNRTQIGSPISETQLESHKKKFLLSIDCHWLGLLTSSSDPDCLGDLSLVLTGLQREVAMTYRYIWSQLMGLYSQCIDCQTSAGQKSTNILPSPSFAGTNYGGRTGRYPFPLGKILDIVLNFYIS